MSVKMLNGCKKVGKDLKCAEWSYRRTNQWSSFTCFRVHDSTRGWRKNMPENSATAKYGENIPGANTIFHKSC